MCKDIFEPLSEEATENLCNASDNENEKLKVEIDELKSQIQGLTRKNQRLQKSVEKKQISERSYSLLQKSFVKYVEESQTTINNLATSLDRAERYIRDIEESARKMKWKTNNVDKQINELFKSVNDMFETLSAFGIKDGKWSYSDWLRVNVPDENGKTEEPSLGLISNYNVPVLRPAPIPCPIVNETKESEDTDEFDWDIKDEVSDKSDAVENMINVD